MPRVYLHRVHWHEREDAEARVEHRVQVVKLGVRQQALRHAGTAQRDGAATDARRPIFFIHTTKFR